MNERDAIIADLMRRVEALEGEDARLAAEQVQPSPVTPALPVAPASTVASAPPVEPSSQRSVVSVDVPGASEPGRVVVDEDAAERALERSLVQSGALLLGPGQMEITPSFSYIYSEVDAVARFGNDEETFFGSVLSKQQTLQTELGLRFGLPFQAQGELSLPYEQVDRQVITGAAFSEFDASDERERGFGDFRIGIAKGLAREGKWRPDLVGRVVWNTASGSDGSGEAVSFQLNAAKRLDPVVFSASLAYTHAFPYDGIRPDQSFGYSVSALLAASPETSLRLGFSQSFVGDTESDQGMLIRSDYTTASLNLGASVILRSRTLLDVSGSVGLTSDSPDFGLSVSLPIRFNP